MNKKIRRKIFERFREVAPHPVIELDYSSNFELLIAVMLSAQSTDVGVNKATAKLFPVANTPQQFIELGVEKLKEYIKTIGLFNTKAQNVIKTSARLLEVYNGEVPNSRKALESLPGVGRKSANVVLSCAFNIPTIAVDTHVFRVANRTGLAYGKTPIEIELKLLKNTEKEFLPFIHYWLVLHGRYVCIARKPRCPSCIIHDLCEYKFKTV